MQKHRRTSDLLRAGALGLALAATLGVLPAAAAPSPMPYGLLADVEGRNFEAAKADLHGRTERAASEVGAYLDSVASLLADLAKGDPDHDASMVLKVDANASWPVLRLQDDTDLQALLGPTATLGDLWSRKRRWWPMDNARTAGTAGEGPAVLVAVASPYRHEAYAVEVPQAILAGRLATVKPGALGRAALVDADGNLFLEVGGNAFPFTKEAVASLTTGREGTLVTGGQLLAHALVGGTGWQLVLQLPLAEAAVGMQPPAATSSPALRAPGTIVMSPLHPGKPAGAGALISLLALGLVGLGTGRWLKQRSTLGPDEGSPLPSSGYDLDALGQLNHPEAGGAAFPTPLLSTYVEDWARPAEGGSHAPTADVREVSRSLARLQGEHARLLQDIEATVAASTRQVKEAVDASVGAQRARLGELADDLVALRADLTWSLESLSARQEALERLVGPGPIAPDAVVKELQQLQQERLRLQEDLAALHTTLEATRGALEGKALERFAGLDARLEGVEAASEALRARLDQALTPLFSDTVPALPGEAVPVERLVALEGAVREVEQRLAGVAGVPVAEPDSARVNALEVTLADLALRLADLASAVDAVRQDPATEGLTERLTRAEGAIVLLSGQLGRLTGSESNVRELSDRVAELADAVAKPGVPADLDARAEAADQALRDLAGRLAQLGTTVAAETAARAELGQGLEARIVDLEGASARLWALEQWVATERQQRPADADRLATLEEGAGVLAARLGELADALQEAPRDADRDRLEALATDHAALSNRVGQGVTAAEAAVTALQAQLAAAAEATGRVEMRVEKLEHQARWTEDGSARAVRISEEAHERLDSLAHSIEAQGERLDGLVDRFDGASDRLDGLAAGVEATSDRIEAVAHRVEVTRTDLEASAARLTERVTELSRQVDARSRADEQRELAAQLAEARGELVAVQAQLAGLAGAVQDLDGSTRVRRLEAAEASQAELGLRLATVDASLTEVHDRLDGAAIGLDHLAQQAQQLAERLEGLANLVQDRAPEGLAALPGRLADAEALLGSLGSSLTHAVRTMAEASGAAATRLDAAEALVADGGRQLADLAAAVADLRANDRIERLADEIGTHLTPRVGALEATVEALAGELRAGAAADREATVRKDRELLDRLAAMDRDRHAHREALDANRLQADARDRELGVRLDAVGEATDALASRMEAAEAGTRRLFEMEARAGVLAAELAAVRSKVGVLEGQVPGWVAEAGREALEQLQANNDAFFRQIEGALAELDLGVPDAIADEIAVQRAAIAGLTQRMDGLATDQAAAQEVFRQVQEQVDQTLEALHRLAEASQELVTSTRDEARERLDAHDAAIQRLDAEAAARAGTLDELRTALDAATGALGRQLDDVAEDGRVVRDNHFRAIQHLEQALDAAIASARTRFDELDTRSRTTQAEAARQAEAQGRQAAELRDLEGQVEQAATRIDRDLAALRGADQGLAAQLQTLGQQHLLHRERTEGLARGQEGLASELAAAKAQVEQRFADQDLAIGQRSLDADEAIAALRADLDAFATGLPHRVQEALPFTADRVEALADHLEALGDRLGRAEQAAVDGERRDEALADRLARVDARLSTTVQAQDLLAVRDRFEHELGPRLSAMEAELTSLSAAWAQMPQHPAVLAAQLAAIKGKLAQLSLDVQGGKLRPLDGPVGELRAELTERIEALAQQVRAASPGIGGATTPMQALDLAAVQQGLRELTERLEARERDAEVGQEAQRRLVAEAHHEATRARQLQEEQTGQLQALRERLAGLEAARREAAAGLDTFALDAELADLRARQVELADTLAHLRTEGGTAPEVVLALAEVKDRLDAEARAREALRYEWESQLGRLTQENFGWVAQLKESLLASVDRALTSARDAEGRFAQALARQQARLDAVVLAQQGAQTGHPGAQELEARVAAALEEGRGQVERLMQEAPQTERLLRSLKDSEARFVKVLSSQHLKVEALQREIEALRGKL